MKIGNVTISAPLALAPMAGVTDLAFRTICREFGAGYTVTEMVSAKALCFQDGKTLRLLELGEREHPAAVQLFGAEPDCMARAAEKVMRLVSPDILDINMGCPVPKVVNNGEGSALLRDPDRAAELVKAVKSAAGVPVTVKTRKGWDKGSVNAVPFCQAMEAAGADAVILHGRTRTQMYSGRADWDTIRAVRETLTIPVIANGDIFEPEDAAHILRYTGCALAMVGRGAFGNPWLFRRGLAAIRGEAIPPEPTVEERCDTAMRQFSLALRQKGEKIACLEARKHYAWYLRGVRGASRWKERICKVETMEDLRVLTARMKRDLALQEAEAQRERERRG